MRTVLHPEAVAGHGRYLDCVACPLTPDAYAALTERLADLHVRAEIHRLTVLRLRADGPVSTRDEVEALRAVYAVTDMPMRWERP